MNDSEWEKFFELVGKIVNMLGTASEKAATFRAKAEEAGCEGDLQELASYISE